MNAGPLLAKVLDTELLADMLRQRYVLRTRHPQLPLSIYNYSESAMYDRVWNAATMTCRGLIVDDRSGQIIARPFRKFFNHNQPEASGLSLTGPVTVTDKADGSLGILYPTGDGTYAVATRGSFTSEQAQHATAVWQARYAGRWAPPDGYTALFEVIYPANRIVLDYHGLDDLILLGLVHTNSGGSRSPRDLWHGWSGPVVETFPYRTYAEALAAEPRQNAEGLVVHFVNSDDRVKIKQDDYLQLHRIITGCTARVLWEHLAVNACTPHVVVTPRTVVSTEYLTRRLMLSPERIERVQGVGPNWFAEFLSGVPDEFYQWVQQRVGELTDQVAAHRAEITAAYRDLLSATAGDRKAFALRAKEHTHSGALFSLFLDREIETYLWRLVYPAHETPFMTRSEAAA